jgi:hypothetical protein
MILYSPVRIETVIDLMANAKEQDFREYLFIISLKITPLVLDLNYIQRQKYSHLERNLNQVTQDLIFIPCL